MGAWVLGFLDPYLLFVGGAIALLTGAALFCVATLRSGVLPRAAVVPLIIGALMFPLVNPEDRRAFPAVPLGIGWVWLG
jgi:hypothetical protein